MDPLTAHVVEYNRATENLVALVRADGMTVGLDDEHTRDLARALIERDAGLPAALMAVTADQQKVRTTAALQALHGVDEDAFDPPRTPYYLLQVCAALAAPHSVPEHDAFAFDRLNSNTRRRMIKAARARLRSAGKEIPVYDPAAYALAAPSARSAHRIEQERTQKARPYSAHPAGTAGQIAGRPEPTAASPQRADDADDRDRDALRPAHMMLSPMKIRRK